MAGLTQTRIRDLVLFNPEINPTPTDQLYLVVDHPSFAEPLKVLFPVSAAQSDVLLGNNLISSSGWTSTGWTGNESIGWTHTAGNTTVLSNTLAALIDSNYQIQLTVTNRTAGSFIVGFGGDVSPSFNSSAYYTILATTNGNLTITPTSDFDGTILIQIKEVIWELTEQEILDILGKDSLYSQAEVDALLALKVDKEAGKSLLADTEIARLLTIKSNPYQINMPAGNITTKVGGATFLPLGWATIAQSGDYDILITHILTGRKAGFVNVFEVDGTKESLLSFDKGTAYTGVDNDGLTTLIKGLATTTLPIVIKIVMD